MIPHARPDIVGQHVERRSGLRWGRVARGIVQVQALGLNACGQSVAELNVRRKVKSYNRNTGGCGRHRLWDARLRLTAGSREHKIGAATHRRYGWAVSGRVHTVRHTVRVEPRLVALACPHMYGACPHVHLLLLRQDTAAIYAEPCRWRWTPCQRYHIHISGRFTIQQGIQRH